MGNLGLSPDAAFHRSKKFGRRDKYGKFLHAWKAPSSTDQVRQRFVCNTFQLASCSDRMSEETWTLLEGQHRLNVLTWTLEIFHSLIPICTYIRASIHHIPAHSPVQVIISSFSAHRTCISSDHCVYINVIRPLYWHSNHQLSCLSPERSLFSLEILLCLSRIDHFIFKLPILLNGSEYSLLAITNKT